MERITVLDGARSPIVSFGGPTRPVGITGAILRLAKDMIRRGPKLGIVTMYIGGGKALDALFRRI